MDAGPRTASTADDSSSSQSSGVNGESPLGVLSAGNIPGRARRKVSFQIDEGVQEISGSLRSNSTAGEAADSHVDTPKINADLKVFCVHCGKQVPSEILRVGTCFCTYCGQRHPDNLMSWASRSHKIPTLGAEQMRLQDEMASRNAKHMRPQPCSSSPQVAAPCAANISQLQMQHVPWMRQHLGQHQSRPSLTEPAYVRCAQLAL